MGGASGDSEDRASWVGDRASYSIGTEFPKVLPSLTLAAAPPTSVARSSRCQMSPHSSNGAVSRTSLDEAPGNNRGPFRSLRNRLRRLEARQFRAGRSWHQLGRDWNWIRQTTRPRRLQGLRRCPPPSSDSSVAGSGMTSTRADRHDELPLYSRVRCCSPRFHTDPVPGNPSSCRWPSG